MNCFHTRALVGPEEHDTNVRRTSAERGIPSLLAVPCSVRDVCLVMFMHATDGIISRQVPPRGLGACRGSTRSGHKELALPGDRESQRGTGIAPTALPQDRPLARRSVLSGASGQGRSHVAHLEARGTARRA